MPGTDFQAVAVAPASPSGTTITRKLLLSAAIGIIAVAALLFFLRTVGPILSFDGKSYAQIARQIVRGEGMTSKIIGRAEMTDRDLDPSHWRNQIRPPAAVYMQAWMFRLAGVNDLAATLWPAIFSVATAVMIFWFAEPLFGPAIAFVSGVAFALSPTGLKYPAAGLTEPLAMFLLLVSVVLLLRFRTAWAAALIGLSMALCALTRPVAYLWTVVLAGLWVWRAQTEGRRWIAPVVALAITFLAPLLLVSRLVHWEGGRLALAINLAWRTDGSLEEALRSPVSFVLHHPAALARKVFIELGRVGAYAFRFGDVLLFSPLALFGLAMRRTEPSMKLARVLVLALVLGNAAALSVLNEGDAFAGPLRYFDVFVPLLLPWGVAAVWLLRDRIRRPVFVALLAVMLAGSAIHVVRDPGLKPKPETAQLYRDLNAVVPAHEVVAPSGAATIDGMAIAWYADRYVIALSNPALEIAELRLRGMPLNWYFATDADAVPPSFTLVRQWPGGFRLYRGESLDRAPNVGSAHR